MGGVLLDKKLFTAQTQKTEPQKFITPAPTPTKKSLVIKRITPEGEKVIYQKPIEYGDYKILRWQNYLFFEPSEGINNLDPNVVLLRHNLETGETEAVYRKENPRIILGDLKVIGNTLFFSVGAYLMERGMFWLDTPTSAPQEIKYEAEFGADEIVFEYGRYWLRGGEGDACWGIKNYALFDPKTKSVAHVATSYEGCAEGEEFITVDSKDRMIMAYHRAKEGTLPVEEEKIYEYIVAIPLDSPNNRQFLVDKEKMPKGVRAIRLLPESNYLVLIGEESLYLFDLISSQLEKFAKLSIEEDILRTISTYPELYNWDNTHFCLSGGVENSPTFLFNLIDRTTEKDSNFCKENRTIKEGEKLSPEEKSEKEAEELISRLNLPSNYKMAIE